MDWTVINEIFTNPTVVKFAVAILGVAIISALFGLFNRLVAPRIHDVGNRYRLRKFITFLSYFTILLFITVVFSDRLGNLTVALGVAGAGITFALQEVIASIAGWFAISFAGFYRIGDRVQIGAIRGDVIDIGILRTTLMEIGEWINADQYNGRIVRIANSFVFREPVYNYSGDFPFVWDEVNIPIKFISDQRTSRRIMERVLEETSKEDMSVAETSWRRMVRKYLVEPISVEPMVTISINDNWVTYNLRYVVHYKRRRFTKDQVYSRVLQEIENSNGAVELASATVRLVEPSVLDVRLKRSE